LNDYGLMTDEDILTEVIKMEFDKDSVIESLHNRVQNEDVYNRINLNEAAAALAQRPTGYIDYQGTNMSVKRKLPYDSEIECSITGVSKKQNFDPSGTFAHDSGTNVDNRGLKIPLNMHPLHGDSSSIEISLTQTADSLAHEQQHGIIDIPSQPVIVGPTSTLSGTCASAAAGMTTAICSQQRPLYPHGLQQFPLNKGNIPFTPDAIPSTITPDAQRQKSHVEKIVKIQHASSPKKPIYLIGESFGGCLALALAARNPTVDLVIILANPATSFERFRDIITKDTLIWRLKLLKSTAAICCLMSEMILGVVSFSMGVVMALYCATCHALGQYGNGIRFPINLSVVMSMNGWIPCSRIVRSRVHASQEAIRRASSLHILLCHGKVICFTFGGSLLTTYHCQWSCKESCLDLLLHVKPCSDRAGPFVIEGLLKD
ncbi:alpha/beta hydrolase fold protein, partial [Tanacetum coccineum]